MQAADLRAHGRQAARQTAVLFVVISSQVFRQEREVDVDGRKGVLDLVCQAPDELADLDEAFLAPGADTEAARVAPKPPARPQAEQNPDRPGQHGTKQDMPTYHSRPLSPAEA